jgi:hypothetical protein
VVVSWVAISWVVLGAELMFAVWAWRYSSAPLAASLGVAAGVWYFDLPSVPVPAMCLVALFLVPVPFVEYVVSLRRGLIASDSDPLERRDPEQHQGVPKIDAYLDQHTLTMRGLGFRYAGDFVETTTREDTTIITYTRVFNGSDLRERATLQGVVWRRVGRDRTSRPALTYTSRLANGHRVVTTNDRVFFPLRGVPGEDVATFPRRRDAAQLLVLHRARLAHRGEAADRQPTPHDWLEESRRDRQEAFASMMQRRLCKRVGKDGYRLTWRGAFHVALADSPTWRPYMRFLARLEEKRMIAELQRPPVVEQAAPAPGAAAAALEPMRQRAS